MTDKELDALRQAMIDASPSPDEGIKAAHIAQAEEIFLRSQESTNPARPTPDRPRKAGLLKGVLDMVRTQGMRGGLIATTAIVAVGFVALMPQWREAVSPTPPLVVATNEISSSDTRLRQDRDATKPASSELQDKNMDAPAEPVLAESAPQSAIALGGVMEEAEARIQAPSAGGMLSDSEADGYAIIAEPNTEAFANEQAASVKITAVPAGPVTRRTIGCSPWSMSRHSPGKGKLLLCEPGTQPKPPSSGPTSARL